MNNLVPTNRDFEILQMVSRVGFLTEKQICALFYSKHQGPELDMVRARGSLSKRICQLVSHQFLSKSVIPASGTINRMAYLLGPAGAELLKNNREIESRFNNNWIIRKSNDLLIRSRHDLIATNFLVNLIMLSRALPDFHLVDWLPDRDCRFYIPRGNKNLLVHPDLYLRTSSGAPKVTTLFLEVDRGTLHVKDLGIKILRLFQYFASKKYQRDLEDRRFPRLCFLAADTDRMRLISATIRHVKDHYTGPAAETISRIPFWLSTFEQIEVNSIDLGFISHRPLENHWIDEMGTGATSPLVE